MSSEIQTEQYPSATGPVYPFDVRQRAMEFAMGVKVLDDSADQIVKRARTFETYLLGKRPGLRGPG